MIASRLYVLTAACLLVTAIWVYGFNFIPGGDYWEHAAALRAWSASLIDPGNPQLISSAASPRYTPLLLPPAILSALFNLPVDIGMAVQAAWNASLLLIGIFLFLRQYFQSSRAPLIGLLVLLGAWGTDVWLWSSVYAYPSLVYVLPYASTGAFGASLVILGVAIHWMRRQETRWRQLSVIALGAAVVLSSHLLTGAFLIAALAVLALTEPRVLFRTKIFFAGATFIGFMLAFLWPFYSVFDTLTYNSNSFIWLAEPRVRVASHTPHDFYKIQNILSGLGMALLGCISAVWFAIARKRFTYIVGILVFLAPFLINLFVYIPLGHRFFIFSVFFMHLAIIHNILFLSRRVIHRPVFKFTTSGVLLAGLGSYLVLVTMVGLKQAADIIPDRGESPPWEVRSQFDRNAVARIARELPSDAVVGGSRHFIWRLGAYGVPVLSLQHQNPLVDDTQLRDTANFILLHQEGTDHRKDDIVSYFSVTHILVVETRLASWESLEAIERWAGPADSSDAGIHLFSVAHRAHAPPDAQALEDKLRDEIRALTSVQSDD